MKEIKDYSFRYVGESKDDFEWRGAKTYCENSLPHDQLPKSLLDEAGNRALPQCHLQPTVPFNASDIFIVNHVDRDPLNNHPDNKQTLCVSCYPLEYHRRNGKLELTNPIKND